MQSDGEQTECEAPAKESSRSTEGFMATLTEGFPCFFLSCTANARVKLAKTGHGPHSSTLVVICVVLCTVCV